MAKTWMPKSDKVRKAHVKAFEKAMRELVSPKARRTQQFRPR